MRPNAGDHAAEHSDSAKSRNEPDHSNNELAQYGLDSAGSGVDFDSAELRQHSTGTDTYRALYSCGRKQRRAVADVGNESTKKGAWILYESTHFSFVRRFSG